MTYNNLQLFWYTLKTWKYEHINQNNEGGEDEVQTGGEAKRGRTFLDTLPFIFFARALFWWFIFSDIRNNCSVDHVYSGKHLLLQQSHPKPAK